MLARLFMFFSLFIFTELHAKVQIQLNKEWKWEVVGLAHQAEPVLLTKKLFKNSKTLKADGFHEACEEVFSSSPKFVIDSLNKKMDKKQALGFGDLEDYKRYLRSHLKGEGHDVGVFHKGKKSVLDCSLMEPLSFKPNLFKVDMDGYFHALQSFQNIQLNDQFHAVDSDLSFASFFNVQFTKGFDAQRTSLNGLLLEEVKIVAGNFSATSMQGAKIKNSNLQDVRWLNTNLRHLDMSETTVKDGVFQDVDASFARLNEAKFIDCEMEKTSFFDSSNELLEFKSSNGKKIDLRNSTILNWTVVDSSLPEIRLADAYVVGVDFQNTNMDDGYFSDAQIDLGKMDEFHCHRCEFQYSTMEGVRIETSYLQGSNYSHSTIKDCQFPNSNLSGVQFNKSTLVNVDFRGAELEGASFNGATLKNCQFDQAENLFFVLSGAKLEGTNPPKFPGKIVVGDHEFTKE